MLNFTLSPNIHLFPASRWLGVRNAWVASLLLLAMVILPFSSAKAQISTFTTAQIETGTGCDWPFSSLAVNPVDGKVYGFWRKGSGLEAIYKLIRFDGTGWTTVSTFAPTGNSGSPINIPNFDNATDDVDIAIDALGRFHVTFRGSRGGGFDSVRGVWYGLSTNGTSWSFTEVQTFSDPSGFKGTNDPVIEVDANNRPHVAFITSDVNSPRTYGIRYYRYTGTEWVGETALSINGGVPANEVNNFDMAIDGAGKAHLAIQRETNNMGRNGGLVYMTNSSGSWSPLTVVAEGAQDQTQGNTLGIDTDANNKVYIVYSNYLDQIYISDNTSGSFSAPQQVNSNLSGDLIDGSFHINSNGSKSFGYYSRDLRVGFAYQPGGTGTWATALAYTAPAEARAGNFPSAILSNSGRVIILFDNLTTGNNACSAQNTRKLWYATATVQAPTTPAPSFTQAPASTAVCTGNTATFTVTTTGATNIQWQQDDNAGFSSPTTIASGNISPGSASGVTSTLSIAANASVNGQYFRAVATNSTGSTNSSGALLTVNALPTPSITGLASAYCKNAAAVTLTGSPSGGTFTVDGTTATSFNPAALATGSHAVVYRYTNGSGCTNTASQNVTVNPLPTVSITGLASAYCKDAAAVTLTGSPTGGSFTVDGTSATSFNPATLATGSHGVAYTFTNGNGCTNTATQNVTINDLPTVSITGLASAYCKSASAVTLAGSPTGGSFTIDGNSATSFNPSTLATGSHTVVYRYTNSNGCTNTATQSVTVNPLPVVAITGLASAYCKDAAAVTLTATPAGGSFYIDAATLATQFNPAALADGSHTVYYTYTDGNGCTNSTIQNVIVNPLPVVSITNLASAYCKDASAVTLTGSPVGGRFTIDGNPATSFNPANLTAGAHSVLYSYTNNNGCTNTTTQSVAVNALPVVSITGLASAYCRDAATVTLTGTPAGGSFTVDGTSATQFAPGTIALGSHTVRYVYTDGNGCTNATTQNVTVNPLPFLSITGLATAYCQDAGTVTLTATPTGGSFAIDGTPATQFNPAILAVGNRTVDYRYTDANGCSNTATQIVRVKATPPTPTLLTQSGGAYPASQSAVTVDVNSGNVNLVVGGCAGTISWSGPNNSSGAGSTIMVATNQPGTFTYRASCQVDGCTSPLATAVVTVGGRLTVLHRDVDNYADNNAIQPLIVLQNQGLGALPLSGLTVRYYLTVEGASALSNLSVNYAQIGNQNVRLRYVPLSPVQQGAAGYVEYSFTSGAGSLAPGASSGAIQTYFAKGDYSGLNERDDYSYATVRDQLVSNLRITAYYNGVLIAGIEPGTTTQIRALRALTESKNGPSATQISTYLDVRNEGNVPVNYSDIKARYYFTSDGNERLQVEVDEGNVQTQLVALNPAVGGANYYLEIRYNQGGQLAPGASTGRVRYRISKPDGGRFDQTNDYSYQEQPAESSSNSKVVVYAGADRLWGREPGAAFRMAVAEPNTGLQVTVLGNPVRDDAVLVQITGAGAQPLQLQLISAQGKLVDQKQVLSPQPTEQQQLSLQGQGAGIFLLQVSTPTERQTIKVLKAE
ncbi:cellulose binding domain-containing protein [Fibrella forsythiae]|uniref:T9SS type A sorting domain-containing protein n=1 Tax=Fibrella forsythiae TaxID=2817061 RepID=A0ABS3JLR6_9BACT|nr:cellulose binding domain-containing protein [Fibrella forsythiae]MBO0950144.1 T9SS type A sorting domain-containing protein [Fibrella forsythiae]